MTKVVCPRCGEKKAYVDHVNPAEKEYTATCWRGCKYGWTSNRKEYGKYGWKSEFPWIVGGILFWGIPLWIVVFASALFCVPFLDIVVAIMPIGVLMLLFFWILETM